MIRPILTIMVAIGLGVARVWGVRHESFQAAAHLFIGGLFGGAVASGRWESFFKTRRCADPDTFPYPLGSWKLELGLVAGLSILELACFLIDTNR